MNDEQRWNTALAIVIDDLNEPNAATRQRAYDAEVFVEFYEIRQQLLEEAHRKFATHNKQA